jgi:hypothetical protein
MPFTTTGLQIAEVKILNCNCSAAARPAKPMISLTAERMRPSRAEELGFAEEKVTLSGRPDGFPLLSTTQQAR